MICLRDNPLTSQLLQLLVSLIIQCFMLVMTKSSPMILTNFLLFPPSPSSSSNLQLYQYFSAMPMANQSSVVMGFPVRYYETPPRYEEPTFITSPEPPLPCNNPDEKVHRCVKWLVFTLVVIVMLSVFLAFSVFCLTNQNKAPNITIESITVSNISASPKDTVSANWHLTFYLENPNSFASIHYKKIQVSVFHRDKRLSSGNVDNFYQHKREEGRMKMEIAGLVMDMEKEKMDDADEMVVSLKLDAVVWLETKFKKDHRQLLEANCGNVKVRPSMNLSFDESGGCNVNLQ